MSLATPLDNRSTNALWASVMVETLVRRGVTRAVISPGSRSTPLTIALARHGAVTATPVLDERSAGFFALGLAKATGVPVVLLCTSGTAAANYFPAIVEAAESGVPLLVLTADRPPEMRACASGQTIDQQKLFGSYVRFFHETAVPELDLGRLRYLRQTLVHAVERSLQPFAGPVHLNLPFRDPLAPLPDEGVAAAFAGGVDWDVFFGSVAGDRVPEPSVREIPASVLARLSPDAHGLIVAGPNQPVDSAGFARDVGELARRLGWPVLADGLTPLRNRTAVVPNVVTTYDVILRNPSAAERLRPDVVLCLGEWPTSKVLRGWLESFDPEIWLLSRRVDNRDALHARTRQLALDPRALAGAIWGGVAAGSELDASAYLRRWLECERQVRTAMDARLFAETELVEPKAAWLLAQHLPPGTPLFIANSMPIRDVEYVWPAGNRQIVPWCNRGANGIDGTLSSALGVALAAGQPAVLLTGDLALLHDATGFLSAGKSGAALTIVVINNAGGGIFEHLPVARFNPPFEEFFGTPQDVDVGAVCRGYGLPHEEVTDWAEFVSRINRLPVAGVRVVELKTDRKRDAAYRKALFADLSATLALS